MEFDLDPAVAYLNHGSYGAVPQQVQRAAAAFRERCERNPLRFNRLERSELLAGARAAAAGLLHSDADDVALVRNVTEGVSTILRSIELRSGDELVIANHGYGAVRIALEELSRRASARVVEARFGIDAEREEIVSAYAGAAGPRTRLVVVDQLTAPTAMVLPVAEIAAAVRQVSPDAVILVDAAHVPAHLDVDPATLGVDAWVGNLHKWGFVPRACAALWVAPWLRTEIRPLVSSWSLAAGFPRAWDEPGTQDVSGWLAVPAAVDFFRSHGGFEQVRRNAALVTDGQEHVAGKLGTEPVVPRVGAAPMMRLVRLPEGMLTREEDALVLYERLSTQFTVEAAPIWFEGSGFVRVTGQVYNRPDDYARLADALLTIQAS